MSTIPRVSIVMPVHNAAATVEEAVRSAQAQTMHEWELLAWDDASTDDSRALLAAINEPRLVVMGSDENIGPGPARNGAMAQARGRWITFLDADDCWAPRRLETLLSATGDRDDTLVFDDVMICHDTLGRRLVAWRRLHGEHAFLGYGATVRDVPLPAFIRSERLLVQPLFPTWYVQTAAVWQTSRRFAEDTEFIFALAAAGVRLRYVPEPLYFYRVTPGSSTARASDVTLMRSCIEDALAMTDWNPETQAAFADKIRNLHRNEALYLLYRAWKMRAPLDALRIVAATPGVLAILPRRVMRVLSYHLHRLIHGGATR